MHPAYVGNINENEFKLYKPRDNTLKFDPGVARNVFFSLLYFFSSTV